MNVLNHADAICVSGTQTKVELKPKVEYKIGLPADSLEYTGPPIVIRFGTGGENDYRNVAIGPARHPLFHYIFDKETVRWVSPAESSFGMDEVTLRKCEIKSLKDAAREKVSSVFSFLDDTKDKRVNGSDLPTLFDLISQDNKYLENYGDCSKGEVVVLHFVNKNPECSDDLRDKQGVMISTTNPIMHIFWDCKVVGFCRRYSYQHIYIREPDFTSFNEK